MSTGTMLSATSGYGYVYIEQLPAIVCPLYPSCHCLLAHYCPSHLQSMTDKDADSLRQGYL